MKDRISLIIRSVFGLPRNPKMMRLSLRELEQRAIGRSAYADSEMEDFDARMELDARNRISHFVSYGLVAWLALAFSIVALFRS